MDLCTHPSFPKIFTILMASCNCAAKTWSDLEIADEISHCKMFIIQVSNAVSEAEGNYKKQMDY